MWNAADEILEPAKVDFIVDPPFICKTKGTKGQGKN